MFIQQLKNLDVLVEGITAFAKSLIGTLITRIERISTDQIREIRLISVIRVPIP